MHVFKILLKTKHGTKYYSVAFTTPKDFFLDYDTGTTWLYNKFSIYREPKRQITSALFRL